MTISYIVYQSLFSRRVQEKNIEIKTIAGRRREYKIMFVLIATE